MIAGTNQSNVSIGGGIVTVQFTYSVAEKLKESWCAFWSLEEFGVSFLKVDVGQFLIRCTLAAGASHWDDTR